MFTIYHLYYRLQLMSISSIFVTTAGEPRSPPQLVFRTSKHPSNNENPQGGQHRKPRIPSTSNKEYPTPYTLPPTGHLQNNPLSIFDF
ncbi:hypothetical protein ACN42_g3698 [Penicillium freii]|uniref:Uncharacterized protein n=1 Tax=Penicillium freii TaxID=48697 RepID=A0A101MMN8_PENFR|nr:hypothetical protein ACN42_g3698 [Penicillium freii]